VHTGRRLLFLEHSEAVDEVRSLATSWRYDMTKDDNDNDRDNDKDNDTDTDTDTDRDKDKDNDNTIHVMTSTMSILNYQTATWQCGKRRSSSWALVQQVSCPLARLR
jgi:hypothetical protein